MHFYECDRVGSECSPQGMPSIWKTTGYGGTAKLMTFYTAEE
jgi:hypothetical protein